MVVACNIVQQINPLFRCNPPFKDYVFTIQSSIDNNFVLWKVVLELLDFMDCRHFADRFPLFAINVCLEVCYSPCDTNRNSDPLLTVQSLKLGHVQIVCFSFDVYNAVFHSAITDRGLPLDFTALPKPTGILTECITIINLSIALYRAFDCATLL